MFLLTRPHLKRMQNSLVHNIVFLTCVGGDQGSKETGGSLPEHIHMWTPAHCVETWAHHCHSKEPRALNIESLGAAGSLKNGPGIATSSWSRISTLFHNTHRACYEKVQKIVTEIWS